MGDINRSSLFAQFIIKQFPKAHSILEIAGGKGQVARCLANHKRYVHIIDMQPRLEGNPHPLISYQRETFNSNNIIRQHIKPDLIIGMHPDEATIEIVKYAVKHQISFAVVPCCIKGDDSKGISSFKHWCNKIKDISQQGGICPLERQLHINGKNLVIYGRAKTN